MKKLILGTAIIFASSSCKSEVKKENTSQDLEVEIIKKEETRSLFIQLNEKNKSNVTGKAKFEETNGVVQMTVVVKGLSEGTHAIHIHEKSDCSSDDGKSTGGHWNPTAEPHGKWGAETGFHKGDIGNFMVDNNGIGAISISTDQWCIGCDDPAKNILGKAIIIHQGEDDLISQPSGAAGARVSCGGIIQ